MKEWGLPARAIHHQVEAMRHAHVDRNGYLGDRTREESVARFLDKEYAARIRAAIDPEKAAIASPRRHAAA